MKDYYKLLSSQYALAVGGFCAILIGMGIQRFAYTPILTLYVSQGWLNAAQANYVGAVNLLGYLIGALAAWHVVGRIFTSIAWIKISVILCALSFFACAYNGGVAWFTIWRFIAGYTGAILIIITPSVILQKTPIHYVGRINGIIFTGTPAGILLSGCLVPLLSRYGLSAIWLCFATLAAISAIITLLTVHQTPSSCILPQEINNQPISLKNEGTSILRSLTISYALAGAAFVPYTLFLGAYLNSIGLSTFTSSNIWIAFGIGGVAGTFLTGYLGDKFGIQKTLGIGLLLGALMLVLTIIMPAYLVLWMSSFVMGVLLPSTVTLTCASVKAVAFKHQAIWAKMTLYFAVGQTVCAYIISFLLNRGFLFTDIFFICAFIFLLSAYFTLRT